MPMVDGLEATRFITEAIGPRHRPRVVAMSANVMREDVEAALRAGADAYIAKPFAPSELRITLEETAHRAPEAELVETPESSSTISEDRVRAHLEGDPTGAFLQELIGDFVSMSGDLQVRLHQAAHLRDIVEIRAIVHEYAGMCAVVGAEKLMRLLLRLQDLARSGGAESIEPFVGILEAARRETLDAFEASVSRQAQGVSPPRHSSMQ